MKCVGCDKETSNKKFCTLKCQQNFQSMALFAGGEAGPRCARNCLLRLDGHQCRICNLTEWQGQPTPLVLDHIDGNPTNNDPNNLRLVCPNCDAQLPTYKAKNKGNGRHYRRQRYKEGKSF